MTGGTLNKCCRVVDLRTGTFIIAYVCLVFDAISLVVNCLMAWTLSLQHSHSGYVYMQRFFLFLFTLLVCFKLVLGAALLVGMFKRLPDHLEMWYKGFTLCVLVQTSIAICVAIKSDKSSVWFWLMITERIIVTLITIYFIQVVRSYYYKMCKESNYYQNIVYTQSPKELLDCVKLPNTHTYEDVVFNQTDAKVEEPPKYGFSKKGGGGGVVYSAPRPQPTAVMDMDMPALKNDDQKSSMLYPSLA